MQSEAPAKAVRAELTRVLESSTLAASPRRAELLRFLVEQTLDGRGDDLKESVIAAEIYGDSDYDPKRQAIVRSEIRRLRLSLLEHYAGLDAPPSVRIEILKGSYRPHFVVEDRAVARANVILANPNGKRLGSQRTLFPSVSNGSFPLNKLALVSTRQSAKMTRMREPGAALRKRTP